MFELTDKLFQDCQIILQKGAWILIIFNVTGLEINAHSGSQQNWIMHNYIFPCGKNKHKVCLHPPVLMPIKEAEER